jgi:hypothetical protein
MSEVLELEVYIRGAISKVYIRGACVPSTNKDTTYLAVDPSSSPPHPLTPSSPPHQS